MRFRRFLAILPFLALGRFARAQNQTVYANNITDANNVPVASAQISFAPTVCPAALSGFHKGAGGQSTGQTVYSNVINGTFSVSLPNVDLTNPQDLGFTVTIVDNSSGATLLQYSCVQPSMTGSFASAWCSAALQGCDFDLYIPSIPKIPAVTTGQAIVNNYNSEMLIDVDDQPGADLGAKIIAADAAYAGQPALFGFTVGNTISEVVNLGTSHNLLITGTVNFTGPGMIVPSQHNDIACIGGTLVNAGMTNTSLGNEYKPFFGTTTGGLLDVHIHDCDADGSTSDYAQLFYTNGNGNVDLRIDHNRIHNGTLYVQNSASSTAPTSHLNLSDNEVTMDAGHAGGQYSITSYGPLQHSVIHHNLLHGVAGGIIIFGSDPQGNIGSSNPPYEHVASSGIFDDVIDHNITSGIVGTNSAVFLSFTSQMTVDANEDDGAVDVAYDGETTVDTLFSNNSSTNDATACFGGFYTQVHNVYRGNHCTAPNGQVGFAFQNAGGYPYIVDDITVEGNDYTSPNQIGIWTYQHASGHMHWLNNKVLNGTWANVSYQNDETIAGNYFHFTYALPCSGIGDGNGPGLGISSGNNNDGGPGAYEIVKDNTIVTDVAQPTCAAAIGAGLSYSNGPTPASEQIVHNDIIGPWATALSISSGVTNSAFAPQFLVKDNTFPVNGAITAAPTPGDVAPLVKYVNNFTGITATPANN